MVFVNPYLTREIPMRTMNQLYAKRFEFGNTPGRATIEVSALPEGVHIAYTGVAVRDLSQRRAIRRSEEHTSELQSHSDLVCRLLLEKKNKKVDTLADGKR